MPADGTKAKGGRRRARRTTTLVRRIPSGMRWWARRLLVGLASDSRFPVSMWWLPAVEKEWYILAGVVSGLLMAWMALAWGACCSWRTWPPSLQHIATYLWVTVMTYSAKTPGPHTSWPTHTGRGRLSRGARAGACAHRRQQEHGARGRVGAGAGRPAHGLPRPHLARIRGGRLRAGVLWVRMEGCMGAWADWSWAAWDDGRTRCVALWAPRSRTRWGRGSP